MWGSNLCFEIYGDVFSIETGLPEVISRYRTVRTRVVVACGVCGLDRIGNLAG